MSRYSLFGVYVIKKRPILGLLYDLLKEFHKIVFSYKGTGLDIWMETAAERSVNKIKLMKRIMCGRNSCQLLRAKLLLNEFYHRIN